MSSSKHRFIRMLNVLRESYNKKIANIKMEIVDIKKNVINEDHND